MEKEKLDAAKLMNLTRAMFAKETVREQKVGPEGIELKFVIPKKGLPQETIREALALIQSDAM